MVAAVRLILLVLSVAALLVPRNALCDDLAPAASAEVLEPPASSETPTIVRVTCPAARSLGTAFKHRSGHLLTSASAVGSCDQVIVILPSGEHAAATVTARDSYSDLAILSPLQPIPGRALTFSEEPLLHVGTPTASWGFPAGYDGAVPLMNVGYVAGIQHVLIDKNQAITKLIIGANFNAGLSGSPLVDNTGAVIGIISGTLSPLSDMSFTALKMLGDEQGATFVLQKSNGAEVRLSHGQLVAMILEELQLHMSYVVGAATPLQELQIFLKKNGLDL